MYPALQFFMRLQMKVPQAINGLAVRLLILRDSVTRLVDAMYVPMILDLPYAVSIQLIPDEGRLTFQLDSSSLSTDNLMNTQHHVAHKQKVYNKSTMEFDNLESLGRTF